MRKWDQVEVFQMVKDACVPDALINPAWVYNVSLQLVLHEARV